MKRIYAEQINKLLEDFHFNIEFENNSRALSFCVLQNGIQHVYGGAFCSGDIEATDELKPLLMQVINGEVPKPISLTGGRVLIVQLTSINFALLLGLFITLLVLHQIKYGGSLMNAIKRSCYSAVVFTVLVDVFIFVVGWSYYLALYIWNLIL
ncbi:hypothetical protein N4G41_15130 [Kosakonia sacchari]|uniref:hypothetical protein n=1 Tax=Kosakonia sacchari TaxID=1158459 RepID=UPI002ACD91A4|nr:hypothetical protein [Kosakonia sacchari]MDZ7322966.1 hypothetical protein [Kosakonia sacchari]